MREQTPSAAASKNILNGVDDLTHGIKAVATSWSFIRQQRFENSPFGL
jgi:hypothetical protein